MNMNNAGCLFNQAVFLGDKCSADFVMPQFDSAVELSSVELSSVMLSSTQSKSTASSANI
jgi:hypothetical protein